MKVCFLVAALLLIAPTGLIGQTLSTSCGRVLHLAVDQLDQLYLQCEDGRIIKRDEETLTQYTFDDNLLGEVTSIDVSDPFSPLLYFEDHQTILLLDRTLNEFARLDLRNVESIRQPTVITRSFDDRIWLYDAWDNRIKLIDERGQLLRQTDNLRLTFPDLSAPQSLRAENGHLLALFPGRGVAVFTFTGSFSHWEVLPPMKHYEWCTEGLVTRSGEEVWLWKGTKRREVAFTDSLLGVEQLLPWRGGWIGRIDKKAKIFK